MSDLLNLTINQQNKLIKESKISSEELVQETINHIKKYDEEINSIINFDEKSAIDNAKNIDKKISDNEIKIGSLTGLPVLLKDNISTKNIETTAGSKILKGYIPPYNSYVTEKIMQENGILIGKGNLDEFAMGSSNENSFFGNVKNPWDKRRVPGGSSGGPAAAVSAGFASYSLGSDTGGSIRQPASLCGVSGMKPTYGLVSRYGLIAFASSLDQIGPIARSAEDCGEILNVISGKDNNDSTSIKKDFGDFNKYVNNSVKNLKIGVPREYLDNVDSEIKETFQESIKKFSGLGAEIVDLSLPLTEYALDVYYIIAPSEASSNLSRFDGVKYGYRSSKGNTAQENMSLSRSEGFGEEVKRRIMIGTYTLSAGYYDAYYKKAQQIRTLIINEFKETFKKVDVLLAPTSPTIAFKLGERTDDPIKMYQSDLCTIPINIAGLPAISIPAGFHNKMPIGIQVIGPQMGDQKVLQFANQFQQITSWHKHFPKL